MGKLEPNFTFIETYLNNPTFKVKIPFFVAGGAFTKWEQPINDLDFFFKSETDFIEFEKSIIVDGGILIRKGQNSNKYLFNNLEIDLVKSKFYQSLEEIFESFDFINCCAGYEHTGYVLGSFKTHDDWYLSNRNKQLTINKITYPVSTLRRAFKYVANGYFLCHGGMLRITEALRNATPEQISSKPINMYPVD